MVDVLRTPGLSWSPHWTAWRFWVYDEAGNPESCINTTWGLLIVITRIMIGYRFHVIVAQVFTTCDVIRFLFQKNAFLFFIAVFACYSVCINQKFWFRIDYDCSAEDRRKQCVFVCSLPTLADPSQLFWHSDDHGEISKYVWKYVNYLFHNHSQLFWQPDMLKRAW